MIYDFREQCWDFDAQLFLLFRSRLSILLLGREPTTMMTCEVSREASTSARFGYSSSTLLLSVVFYAFVSVLVLLFWRGGWVFLDKHLYPEDTTLSGYCSLELDTEPCLLSGLRKLLCDLGARTSISPNG